MSLTKQLEKTQYSYFCTDIVIHDLLFWANDSCKSSSVASGNEHN